MLSSRASDVQTDAVITLSLATKSKQSGGPSNVNNEANKRSILISTRDPSLDAIASISSNAAPCPRLLKFKHKRRACVLFLKRNIQIEQKESRGLFSLGS